MVKIEKYAWTIMEILGIVLLAVGAFGVIDIVRLDQQISIGLMVLGIMLISISSGFIHLEGNELRKEDHEIRRFIKIRDEARLVPNDLKEGYLIDYTAEEPDTAVRYVRNRPEIQCECDSVVSDGDAPMY
jgi:hypothetical protein